MSHAIDLYSMSANRNVPDSMVSLLYVRNRLERDILKIMDLTKYRLNEDTMLRTHSSNVCVAAMLPRLATHETLWRAQNVCLRARLNNVAAFSQAQDTKVDTFTHNVSATLCPRLARA